MTGWLRPERRNAKRFGQRFHLTNWGLLGPAYEPGEVANGQKIGVEWLCFSVVYPHPVGHRIAVDFILPIERNLTRKRQQTRYGAKEGSFAGAIATLEIMNAGRQREFRHGQDGTSIVGFSEVGNSEQWFGIRG